MSKRWNNVIDPDDIVAQLGADTLRLYLAFIGPYNEPGSYPWNPDGVAGVRRFLERTWRLQDKIVDDRRNSFSRPGPGETVSPEGRPEIERELHKMIKKVGEDCAELKFNTAIAAMMTFLNTAEGRGLTKQQYVTLVRLLAPFAPHITEELWASFAKASKAKHAKNSVHLQPWPKYDKKKLVSDTVKIIIQINGKMRGEAQVPASADKEAVEAAARAVVADRLAGENVARVIIVPGRLINFVTLTIKKQIV
ncbi:class I tRNA ligase family protein [Candidatus Kaiserbacteria bacterium]|nr:class I tRNA ligase family protein [Candidatus Kaiserbacteria bacterium]